MISIIKLCSFPLMAQSINDTDEARQEYMESVREQEQMRQENLINKNNYAENNKLMK